MFNNVKGVNKHFPLVGIQSCILMFFLILNSPINSVAQPYSLDNSFQCPYNFSVNQSGIGGAIPA